MIEELGLNPIEKEVVILYKGEKQEHSDEFFQVFYLHSSLSSIISYAASFTFCIYLGQEDS